MYNIGIIRQTAENLLNQLNKSVNVNNSSKGNMNKITEDNSNDSELSKRRKKTKAPRYTF